MFASVGPGLKGSMWRLHYGSLRLEIILRGNLGSGSTAGVNPVAEQGPFSVRFFGEYRNPFEEAAVGENTADYF